MQKHKTARVLCPAKKKEKKIGESVLYLFKKYTFSVLQNSAT